MSHKGCGCGCKGVSVAVDVPKDADEGTVRIFFKTSNEIQWVLNI